MAEILEAGKIMNSPELTNCLEFTSKLVSSGKEFKFYVKIGNGFVFNLVSKESGTSSSMNQNRKKKPSHSTKRRNARRLQDFIEKKNSSAQETLEDASKPEEATRKNLVNNDKETFHCDQCEFKGVSGHKLSEHNKVKHSVNHFKWDQCDSVFENEKGLKGHQGKKHKMTLSPIPQVDGHSEILDVTLVNKQKEPVQEELAPNQNNLSGYSCTNFKFKCEGHATLNEHIRSCPEAQAQTKTFSS